MTSKPLYMQYGCGPACPDHPGWVNFDASPTLWLQRLPLAGFLFRLTLKPRFDPVVQYGDILKRLPIPAGSCTGIYCSHVLEHLSLLDMRLALRNTRNCLSLGGTFRCVMPDLAQLVQEYLQSGEGEAAPEFMRRSGLGVEKHDRSAGALLRTCLGNAHHRWLWDYPSLRFELEAAGFKEVRRATLGDSIDPSFNQVEDPLRWQNCLGIECRRLD